MVDKEGLDQSCAIIYPNSAGSTVILLIFTGMFVNYIEEEDVRAEEWRE